MRLIPWLCKSKMNYIVAFFFQILSLIGCRNNGDISKGEMAFHINIEKENKAIDLKLSELIDSCWFIPLETTNESILGSYIHFVSISNDCILIVDNNGIYKFSEKGAFIKKIIGFGRGPDELSGNPICIYDEKKKYSIY